MAKPDAVDWLPLVPELERQMLFSDQALRQDFQFFAEGRRGKTLTPYFAMQHVHQFDPAVLRLQRTIGLDAPRQRRCVQPLGSDSAQCLLKDAKLVSSQRAAGRHGVTAKAQQQARVALGHQVQRVAQVKSGNRAP